MSCGDVDQELALVGDDIAEVGVPQRSVAARAARPLAVALGVAATFGVGFVAAQPHGLSVASLRSIAGLEAQPLVTYKTMQGDTFVKYSGYTGDLEVSGVVTMHNAETPDEDFNWVLSMKGSQATSCSTSQYGLAANACGMMITQGTDCGVDTGNPYYAGTTDPYDAINYQTTSAMSQSVSIGSQKNVATGYTGTQLNGKTLIITDSTGARAACSVIERSVLSDLPGGACFPGDASASVEGRGAVPLSELQTGDRVQVQRPSGELVYEPLLGFLHSTKGASRFLRIQHSSGELSASANHLVFVADGTSKLASELKVGDQVLAVAGAESEKAVPSAVLSVNVVSGEEGMIAPLTMTGSIVVDGTVASAYATHSTSAFIPHGALHALFFPARLLARASFGMWGEGPSPSGEAEEAMHPLANVYAQVLIPFAKNVLSL
eukprot:TRINITY_DN2714_c0_g1_i1.p1 TRINITY_DN2714_c0_g1~~TRINITY_DN2714_c0_g1_i1.p1  ORF type:complete len:435 (+),score=78.21 TRINITY_DN2714_c0_g1_i1:64-1368(+)